MGGGTLMKHSSRVGDLAEHYVITWLWDNGYEVFTNAGCTGPVDIIAVDTVTLQTYLIDVKATSSSSQSGYGRTKEQKDLGVRIVEFNTETRKCRFIKHSEAQ
jgi:Holliday junction resolvase-like predicted endonuclease